MMRFEQKDDAIESAGEDRRTQNLHKIMNMRKIILHPRRVHENIPGG